VDAVARAIAEDLLPLGDLTAGARSAGEAPSRPEGGTDAVGPGHHDVAKYRDLLQRAMTEGAGVVRSASSLATAAQTVAEVSAVAPRPDDRAAGELANLVTAAGSVLASATLRTETRGAHARSDFPDASDAWRCRIVHTAGGRTVLSSAAGDPGPDPAGQPRP